MNIYLDDDLAQPLLRRFFRDAGHDARLPMEFGVAGQHDAVHLRYAIHENRVLLSGNHDDFEFLHKLIMEAKGHHPGILIVRRDNNPKRDLGPRGIVRAVRNLVSASIPLADQFFVLNQWR